MPTTVGIAVETRAGCVVEENLAELKSASTLCLSLITFNNDTLQSIIMTVALLLPPRNHSTLSVPNPEPYREGFWEMQFTV